MAQAPTVWMRAIRPHTYMGRPQDVGDVYLAHEDHPQWGTVENILNLKFAVLDEPPMAARREDEPVEALRASVPAESLRVETSHPLADHLPSKVDTTDPHMAPWPTPSATSEKARARKPRGRTVESIKTTEPQS